MTYQDGVLANRGSRCWHLYCCDRHNVDSAVRFLQASTRENSTEKTHLRIGDASWKPDYHCWWKCYPSTRHHNRWSPWESLDTPGTNMSGRWPLDVNTKVKSASSGRRDCPRHRFPSSASRRTSTLSQFALDLDLIHTSVEQTSGNETTEYPRIKPAQNNSSLLKSVFDDCWCFI